jgi:CheY-like chemotaxis protein
MSELLKILYVDDEEDIRAIVELALGMDPDMDVVTASSGGDALRQIEQRGWMPDLAILDVMMPNMSGIELLAELRRREYTNSLPVVFITASARSAEAERNNVGAIGVISKPFDVINFPSLVRKIYEASKSDDRCRPPDVG